MNTPRNTFRIAAACLLLAGCPPLLAAVVTLTPSKDATIYGASVNQGLPNTSGQDLYFHSNGSGPGIFAGGNGQYAPHRALIAFDVASQLPAGAVVTGAQLTLYIGIVAGSGGAAGLGDQMPRTMDLFRLTRDWGEGATGGNATQIGGTGQGFPADTGDATWLDAAFNETPWTTPGGDYVEQASATLAVGSEFFTPQTWASTPELVGDVQAWLDNPSGNFGWILINRDENLQQTHRAFYSSEWSDPAMRPQLQITYELAAVPVPAAVWSFGTAMLGWSSLARRKAGDRCPRRLAARDR